MSGRDTLLAEARGHFDAGDYESAVEAYERFHDESLSRAD
jgi:hypothetical protein